MYYTCSIKHFKAAPIQVPSCKFLRTAFFIERIRWLLLCLLERRGEKRGTKEQRKMFQMKEENENISFNSLS